MREFKVVEAYKNSGINIPVRATKTSAGYDIEAAETIVIPSQFKEFTKLISDKTMSDFLFSRPQRLNDPETLKIAPTMRATMVPTGLKVYCKPDEYLFLKPRSGVGSKHLLSLEGSGIVDADYADNPDNEGHIFIPLVNSKPYDIIIEKGDRIAQGVFLKYGKTINDAPATESRMSGFGSTGVK